MKCNCRTLFKDIKYESYYFNTNQMNWNEFWDLEEFWWIKFKSINELIEAWNYSSPWIEDIRVLNFYYFSSEEKDKCLYIANLEFIEYINSSLESELEDLKDYQNENNKDYQDKLKKIQTNFNSLKNKLEVEISNEDIKNKFRTKTLFKNHLNCLKKSYPKEKIKCK